MLNECFALEAPPIVRGPSIFLAGPTLRERTRQCPSCRGLGGSSTSYYDPFEAEYPSPICGMCMSKGHINLRSWREDALALLREFDFHGTVFIPENRGFVAAESGNYYPDQAQWETDMFKVSSVVAFWVPRVLEHLPGFTTNVEFGYCIGYGKPMVYGRPDGAPKTRYLDFLAGQHHKVAQTNLHDTMLWAYRAAS